MNKLIWIMLVAVLSLPALGQATRDRNLVATRRHANTTTSLPPEMNTRQSGAKNTNAQLDKLEHQTANTVIQPAAKAAKAPVYKLPPENQRATSNGYQQTMPVHAGVKNGARSASHSSRSPSVKPYNR